MASQRMTVTLPEEMVHEIDGHERNRSRFVQRAVARELERLRQEKLRLEGKMEREVAQRGDSDGSGAGQPGAGGK